VVADEPLPPCGCVCDSEGREFDGHGEIGDEEVGFQDLSLRCVLS
jgi:hypothetical protein